MKSAYKCLYLLCRVCSLYLIDNIYNPAMIQPLSAVSPPANDAPITIPSGTLCSAIAAAMTTPARKRLLRCPPRYLSSRKFSAAEGAKFAATMNDFAKTVAALGENKRLEDLRCKK